MSGLNKPILNQAITEAPSLPGERQAPPQPPIEPAPRIPGPKRTTAILVVASVLALALIGWMIWAERGGNSEAQSGVAVRTAKVLRGAFMDSLRLSGTVAAVQSHAVLAPTISGGQIGSLVITKLAAAGSRIKKGDVLAEFDRQGQIQDFLDKKAEYQDLVDQIARKQADDDAARAKDETDLKQAEDDLKKAQLEVLKDEIVSKIDAEKNQETLQEAQANLKQLRSTFDLKRLAAKADLRVLEIQRDRAQVTMLHSQRNEEKMLIRSPMDGVVVMNTIWKGGSMGQVQEGDEVRPGVPFMQVVDPSAMEVRVPVNQVDLYALRVGQRAQVHLDAYPDLTLSAKLEELSPLGMSSEFSDKLRTFTALFSIQGSDPRLMPDLSAAVDVELAQMDNVLLVPYDSVATDHGATYVMVKEELGWERRPVKLGPRNDLEAVVKSGVAAGDVVERDVEKTWTGS